jgi:lantibiotic modifying enzyme
MLVGDKHNFGKSVEKINFNGFSFFKKPRTFRREDLFFKSESPPKNSFKETPIEQQFSLLVDREKKLVREVQSINLDAQFDYTKFDYLAGYCFCFGLQDLHSKNVVLHKYRLQLIDIEAAFSDLVMPWHTGLKSDPDRNFERSALGSVVETIDHINTQQALELIRGFESCVFRIFKLRANLIQKLKSVANFEKETSRVILRDT